MQERLDREQPGEQRYKNHADYGYTSAGHELLHALRFCARVVVAVTFQQVDDTHRAIVNNTFFIVFSVLKLILIFSLIKITPCYSLRSVRRSL